MFERWLQQRLLGFSCPFEKFDPHFAEAILVESARAQVEDIICHARNDPVMRSLGLIELLESIAEVPLGFNDVWHSAFVPRTLPIASDERDRLNCAIQIGLRLNQIGKSTISTEILKEHMLLNDSNESGLLLSHRQSQPPTDMFRFVIAGVVIDVRPVPGRLMNNQFGSSQADACEELAKQCELGVDLLEAHSPEYAAWVSRELFSQLPEQSKVRFAVSPTTCKQLASPSRSTAEFVEESLIAEHRRLGRALVPIRGVWTALGDRYFRSIPQPLPCAGSDQIRASRLAGRIVVDVSSPYAVLPRASNAPSRDLYAPAHVAPLLRRLEDAMAAIDDICPLTYDFILEVTSVIALVNDIEGEFGSSSWPTHIGKMAVINSHTLCENEQVVNALVHESIHQLLYMVELDYPFYLEQRVKREVMLVSPWTGNPIHLASFVHACFVWYGLWCFWTMADHSAQISRHQAMRFVSRSAQGFEGISPVDRLMKYKEVIAPEVLETISMIGRAVRI